jgi:murein L,D-transpeptidase YcbB/YkuD
MLLSPPPREGACRLFTVLALLAIGCCSSSWAESPPSDAVAIRAAISAWPYSNVQTPQVQHWQTELLQVYQARSYVPLWLIGGGPTSQALAVMSEMRNAEERGLRPQDYQLEELAHQLAGQNNEEQSASEDLLRFDVSLSLSLARFIADLHSGRVAPQKAHFDLEVSNPEFDVIAAELPLATSTAINDTLNSYEPRFLHYQLLKASLARYRQLASRAELTELPDPGRHAITPGASYIGAAALRRLLIATGDLPSPAAQPDAEEMGLDPEMVVALKAFQRRHGLAQDGALGAQTYRALTVPFSDRVRQIELSLERWRWLPPKLHGPSIVVNIPEFRLFAFNAPMDLEQQMLTMDVIVGKSFPIMQTPVFAADIRYLVLNPYWDVPTSIVRRELLPRFRTDPDYISRNDYEIVNGQTDSAEVQPVSPQSIAALARGDLRLRQRPGPTNPLGFVKFMLPNRYDVYLHGTSVPHLFANAQRAFSHGCIRVADPMALINYVLQGQTGWGQDQIIQQLRNPAPHRIDLLTPLPVYIVYATAQATEDGRSLFFKDIYGYDVWLQALLDERSRDLQPSIYRHSLN